MKLLQISISVHTWKVLIECLPFNIQGSFDALLTVHLTVILVINQLNSQILVLYYVYCMPMCSKHVEAYNKLSTKQEFVH